MHVLALTLHELLGSLGEFALTRSESLRHAIVLAGPGLSDPGLVPCLRRLGLDRGAFRLLSTSDAEWEDLVSTRMRDASAPLPIIIEGHRDDWRSFERAVRPSIALLWVVPDQRPLWCSAERERERRGGREIGKRDRHIGPLSRTDEAQRPQIGGVIGNPVKSAVHAMAPSR
jgi:hypothetical protein